ncbi:MAG: hypothetical protein Q7J48_06395, partial [Nocardioides sp.]|nr:hypothetical protein [Nocardioides sp.]
IKPWSRLVITLWVLVTIPLMALMLLALLRVVPRIIASAGSVVRADVDAVGRAWDGGNAIDVSAHTLQLLGVVLPMIGCALILSRIGVRFFRGLAAWSQGSTRKRVVAAAVSATVVTTLFWSWWPWPGNYQPIVPGERGLVTALLDAPPAEADVLARPAPGSLTGPDAVPPGTAARSRLSGGQSLVATYQEGTDLPTEDDPDLVMVLVPTDGSRDDGADATAGDDEAVDDTWVFPFDKPLAPEEGDNQALAVNTTDASVVYDVAFALVWADGDEVANVNEAHAYASCTDCVTVAVAFQVVMIMDDAQVVVPQNLAVAANYDCLRCITAAIASQLVLSVGAEPGEDKLLRLGEVWGRLTQFARNITSYSLTEITAMLDGFQAEIVAIMYGAPPLEAGPSTSPTPTEQSSTPTSPSATPSSSPDGSSTSPTSPPTTTTSPPPTDSASPSPEPTPTPTPTPEPTPTPTPEPTPTPTLADSPSATASDTTSPPLSPTP